MNPSCLFVCTRPAALNLTISALCGCLVALLGRPSLVSVLSASHRFDSSPLLDRIRSSVFAMLRSRGLQHTLRMDRSSPPVCTRMCACTGSLSPLSMTCSATMAAASIALSCCRFAHLNLSILTSFSCEDLLLLLWLLLLLCCESLLQISKLPDVIALLTKPLLLVLHDRAVTRKCLRNCLLVPPTPRPQQPFVAMAVTLLGCCSVGSADNKSARKKCLLAVLGVGTRHWTATAGC